jgi:hypothetical protein
MKTLILGIAALLSPFSVYAQELPLPDFLESLTGEYRLMAGEPQGCPQVVSVTHPSHMGSQTLGFETLEQEPVMRGFIQRIDGPVDSGGPHWDEIVEDRVRRDGQRVVSERRTCKNHFLFTICRRWKPRGPSVSFSEDGSLMALKPDMRWFHPAPATPVAQCRFQR